MQAQLYQEAIMTGHSSMEIDYAMANAEAAISAHVAQVGDVTWRSRRVGSRDSRPIELIDDEG